MPPKKKAVAVVKRVPKVKPPPPAAIKKKKAPPRLPDDWPVHSRPVGVPPEASALRPGSLLEACSGQDIHLARTAVVAPNISKEKGRYLLLLPGILNIKTQQRQQQQAEEEQEQEQEAKNSNDDNNNNNKEDTKTMDKVVSMGGSSSNGAAEDATSTAATSTLDSTLKKAPTSLGRVEGLATDSPVLKVPFPNGKTLIFPGKKVPTTSKYIMLSCSTKKKGSVACKVSDIYLLYIYSRLPPPLPPPKKITNLSHIIIYGIYIYFL